MRAASINWRALPEQGDLIDQAGQPFANNPINEPRPTPSAALDSPAREMVELVKQSVPEL